MNTPQELFDCHQSGLAMALTPDELLPADFFNYDEALEDLREMYERGRQWIADNIARPAVSSADFLAVYEHTLEIAYAMMAFRECAISQEAV